MHRGVVALTVVAAAAVALASSVVSTAASAGSCSPSLARSAVASTKPRITGLSGALTTVDPSSVDGVICFDFTRDGRTDLAMTVASGGTAGDVGWLVLRRSGGGWRLVLGRNGYKVDIYRLGDDIAYSQPIYEKNDANCCPTGGFDHQRFHWNGSRFVVVRTWQTKRA